MTEEGAYRVKEAIVGKVEDVIESGYYSLDEILTEVEVRLKHLRDN